MGDAFKPALHGRDHCPGGVDPIPCMERSYAYLEWGVGGAVTVDTLTDPISIADYDEGFVPDDNSQNVFTVDVEAGVIQWYSPGDYLVSGWAQFAGGATAGSILGAALDFGNQAVFSTFRVGNCIVANAINEEFRIPLVSPVFSFNPGSFGHDSVRVLVHHDDAGGQDLQSIRLQVMRISAIVSGTTYP